MHPGKWIRALREERLIKPSEVERITKNIAETRGNPEFYVPHSTLADIEAGSMPGIYKLFSLALSYKVPLDDLLLPFGLDPAEPANQAAAIPEKRPTADMLNLEVPPSDGSAVREPPFRFQLNFDAKVSPAETVLLKLQSQELAILPPAVQSRIDPVRYRYALIGSNDDRMGDLLPPRSMVEIDTSQKAVQLSRWKSLLERPIYFIWHNEGYACEWCQVDGSDLILIPHPISGHPVRRFKMPGNANVLGMVTNAWLPFQRTRRRREIAS